MEVITLLAAIVFIVCCIGAVIHWGYSAYYMVKTLGNYHPEKQWGKYIAFSLFMPYFFTEEGNKYRKLLLKHMVYFTLLCLLGIVVGLSQREAVLNMSQLTPNNTLKPTHFRGTFFVQSRTKTAPLQRSV